MHGKRPFKIHMSSGCLSLCQLSPTLNAMITILHYVAQAEALCCCHSWFRKVSASGSTRSGIFLYLPQEARSRHDVVPAQLFSLCSVFQCLPAFSVQPVFGLFIFLSPSYAWAYFCFGNWLTILVKHWNPLPICQSQDLPFRTLGQNRGNTVLEY